MRPLRHFARQATDLAAVLEAASAVLADTNQPVAIDAVKRVFARPDQPRPERRVARAPGLPAVGRDERALLGRDRPVIRVAGVDDDVDRRVRRRARLPRAAAVAADLDVGRLDLDGDQLVADDLDLVVVGLRDARRRASTCRRGPWSASARCSRAGRPPSGARRRAGRSGRRSARRGCRRRCRRRADRRPPRPPSRPASTRYSAGPAPIMIVPSPGSTVTELIAGLAAAAAAVVGRRDAGVGRRGGRLGDGGLGRGRLLGAGSSASSPQPARASDRDHARAREHALSAHRRTSRVRPPSRSRRAGAGRTAARRRTPSYDPSRCTPSGRHRSGGTRPADATRRVARARGRAGAERNSYHSSVRVQAAGRPRVAAVPPSTTLTARSETPGSWRLKRVPTSRSYHGQPPRVSDGRVHADVAAAAADEALERGALGAAADRRAGRLEEDHDVVARQIPVGEPTRVRRRIHRQRHGCRPSRRIAATPWGIESCRKPVVFVKTSARKRSGASRCAAAPPSVRRCTAPAPVAQ